MSVMTGSNQYASASRVLGVCRYLLLEKNGREKRRVLEALMSPTSMRGEVPPASSPDRRPMISGTIAEAIKMGIISEDGESVVLRPDLTKGDPEDIFQRFHVILADLVLAEDNSENHDLALSIAWFLGLSVFTPPATWDAVQTAITNQGVTELLELSNNARYSQFVDWACFLGFAWRDPRGALVPNPTPQLRDRLADVFREDLILTMGEATERIAELLPVMEGGRLRTRVDALVRVRPAGFLSESTATAWFNLAEENRVELIYEADAPHLVLPDGSDGKRVSRVRLREDGRPPRRRGRQKPTTGESA